MTAGGYARREHSLHISCVTVTGEASWRLNKPVLRALVVVIVMVSAVLSICVLASYFLLSLLSVPQAMQLPSSERAAGVVLLALGFSLMGWVFRHRSPMDIVNSTYVTLTRAASGVGAKPPERREHLVVKGPHKHVRNPLYLTVLILILGWALLLDLSSVVLAGGLLFAWFYFVVIPFEEKELLTLFGDEYRCYMDETPKIVPFTKSRRHRLE